jgi:hypothetical protein
MYRYAVWLGFEWTDYAYIIQGTTQILLSKLMLQAACGQNLVFVTSQP